MAESTPTPSSFPYSDFKLVSKRQRRKINQTTPPIRSLVIALCATLAQGEWYTKCSNLLKEACSRSSALTEADPQDQPRVLCLGLGSPSASKNARIQLAFLLEACKCLNIAQSAISVCDPIFTPEDITLLEQFNFKVLDQPQTGAYVFTDPTILFMPHCDLELYESILSTNQNRENLSRLILVGNSLQSYLDNRPRAKLQSIAPCVLEFIPQLTEIPLPPCTSWPTAFNNTSIQFLEVEAKAENIELPRS